MVVSSEAATYVLSSRQMPFRRRADVAQPSSQVRRGFAAGPALPDSHLPVRRSLAFVTRCAADTGSRVRGRPSPELPGLSGANVQWMAILRNGVRDVFLELWLELEAGMDGQADFQKSGRAATGTSESCPGYHCWLSAQTDSSCSLTGRRKVTVAVQGTVKAPLSSTVTSSCSPFPL